MNNAGIIDAMTFNANGNPTMKGSYGDSENTGAGYNTTIV